MPGEYEMLLFVDAAPGGGIGPDTAATSRRSTTPCCDPTGVSIRVPCVGCEDATVTLTNKHFIIF